MARVEFVGPTPSKIRSTRGNSGTPMQEIRVKLKDGTVMVFRPRNRAQGFVANEPLEGGARHRLREPRDGPGGKYIALEPFDEDRPGRGRVAADITDPRALRQLRADPRFRVT